MVVGHASSSVMYKAEVRGSELSLQSDLQGSQGYPGRPCLKQQKNRLGPGKMAQQTEMPPTKRDDQSLIPVTYMAE